MAAPEPWWTVTPASDSPRDREIAEVTRRMLSRRQAMIEQELTEAARRLVVGLGVQALNPDGTPTNHAALDGFLDEWVQYEEQP